VPADRRQLGADRVPERESVFPLEESEVISVLSPRRTQFLKNSPSLSNCPIKSPKPIKINSSLTSMHVPDDSMLLEKICFPFLLTA
jgi:hypothetical protein